MSVTVYMLAITWAAIFLLSADLSSSDRLTVGMIRARDGESTRWSNSMLSRACRQGWASAEGLLRADSRRGHELLYLWALYHGAYLLQGLVPSLCSLLWESVSTSIRCGTMDGKQEDSCLGAQ